MALWLALANKMSWSVVGVFPSSEGWLWRALAYSVFALGDLSYHVRKPIYPTWREAKLVQPFWLRWCARNQSQCWSDSSSLTSRWASLWMTWETKNDLPSGIQTRIQNQEQINVSVCLYVCLFNMLNFRSVVLVLVHNKSKNIVILSMGHVMLQDQNLQNLSGW